MKTALQLFLISLSITLLHMESNAQTENPTDYPKNSVYLEVGGNGVLYSINYDRLFQTPKMGKYAIRIGYGFSKNFNNNRLIINTFPFEITGLYSLKNEKHFFEVGPGITGFYRARYTTGDKLTLLLFTARIGYRYQKSDGGTLFRIGFTPLYDFYSFNPQNAIEYNTWLLSAGISVGHTF